MSVFGSCTVRNMAERRESGVLALEHGLEILDVLLSTGKPASGGEIARRVGLHESSVSRLLRTLIDNGYVARVRGGNVPALRMLRFARVTESFPLIAALRPVVSEIADARPDSHVNVCAYVHEELVYLIRAQAGVEPITGLSFPLHSSSAALRLLVDLPREEALAALHRSRDRHGWNGSARLPADPESVLDRARALIDHDTLVLDRWTPTSVTGAIPVAGPGGHPMALAIAGPPAAVDQRELQLVLHDARRRIETVIAAASA